MKKFSGRTLVIAAVITLLLGGSAAALYWQTNGDNQSAHTTETSQTPAEEPQFPGPTDQEKQDADAHKDEVVQQQELEANPPTGQKNVTPVITSVSQNGAEIFASGFVPGIFEDGGSCTFTFTKGGASVVKTVGAFANASTTSCTNVTATRGEFSQAGNWSLVVTYSSPQAKGASAPKEFTVQ